MAATEATSRSILTNDKSHPTAQEVLKRGFYVTAINPQPHAKPRDLPKPKPQFTWIAIETAHGKLIPSIYDAFRIPANSCLKVHVFSFDRNGGMLVFPVLCDIERCVVWALVNAKDRCYVPSPVVRGLQK